MVDGKRRPRIGALGRQVAIASALAVGLVLGLCLIVAVGARPALAFGRLDAAAFRASFAPSTRIFDRDGILLREVVNERGNRAIRVPLDEISPFLVDALLSAEDSRFMSHGGVDWIAAVRALLSNGASGRRVSGASTISMQLARIAFGNARDLPGKFGQVIGALRIEAALGKDEILEEYFNRAPFGPGCEGVEAASEKYCGSAASLLGAADAALLAGMVQAPSLYNPERFPDAAKQRRDWVLGRMLETGRLEEAAYDEAIARPLPSPPRKAEIKAGHFTDYALSLRPEPGDIETSLDWPLQEEAQRLVSECVRRSAPSGLTNAAVVVLDNESGAILAMVGSREWGEGEGGFVNGALALRQPGSALKPFAYALAFERGRSPATMLADIETEYVSDDRTLYIPRNYSRTFRGPILAKEALASSLNIPAIRLTREIGVDALLDKLHSLGFSSLDLDADYYGLGLVLGNGAVSLLELAGAYAALARNGLYIEPSPFPRAAGPQAGGPRRAIEEKAAFLVTSIISDENMQLQVAGPNTPLLAGFPMALKTGTSSNWRDSWTLGYTREFTVGVWAGDFESSSMNQLTGWNGAAPLCLSVARVMADRLGRTPGLPEPPPGLRKIVVCAESGDLPNDFCPRKMVVTVAEGNGFTRCAMHSLAKVDRLTGEPAGDSTPPSRLTTRLAYELPSEFAQWLKDSGKYSPPPAGKSAVAALSAARASGIAITSPRQGDVFIIEPGYDRDRQSIALTALSKQRRSSLEWYVDGRLLAAAPWPYGASWTLAKGRHSVVAASGKLRSESVSFEVR